MVWLSISSTLGSCPARFAPTSLTMLAAKPSSSSKSLCRVNTCKTPGSPTQPWLSPWITILVGSTNLLTVNLNGLKRTCLPPHNTSTVCTPVCQGVKKPVTVPFWLFTIAVVYSAFGPFTLNDTGAFPASLPSMLKATSSSIVTLSWFNALEVTFTARASTTSTSKTPLRIPYPPHMMVTWQDPTSSGLSSRSYDVHSFSIISYCSGRLPPDSGCKKQVRAPGPAVEASMLIVLFSPTWNSLGNFLGLQTTRPSVGAGIKQTRLGSYVLITKGMVGIVLPLHNASIV